MSSPYRIRRYWLAMEEESDCPNCGTPVPFGECAYDIIGHLGDIAEAGFCSKPCAIAWMNRRKKHVAQPCA